MSTDVLRLAGVHHLKLPVRDLARSEAWYQRTLGYRRAAEFVEGDELMGIGMTHPGGGPELGIRRDPARAEAAAGFDYFSIGVPDRAGIEALAVWLDHLGERHGGVHRAMRGWILPYLHDPDGHEVRFYTIEEHSSYDDDRPLRDNAAPSILANARRAAAYPPDQPIARARRATTTTE
ncbi:MAG TPA: VOC family protein [Acidimicrobiales bacterium]|jgi:catechol 2,3-dioxygenase-like lactoylglutathione lyase family enzyme|nr:VOC family protein [Acidimicrobiales bacterium]